jgi:hypothetical protein
LLFHHRSASLSLTPHTYTHTHLLGEEGGVKRRRRRRRRKRQ